MGDSSLLSPRGGREFLSLRFPIASFFHASQLLQHTLRTRNHPSATGVNFHCHPHCPCKCLDRCLNHVVRVNPVKLTDVQRHLAMIHHCHKELPHQLSVVGSHTLRRNLQAVA